METHAISHPSPSSDLHMPYPTHPLGCDLYVSRTITKAPVHAADGPRICLIRREHHFSVLHELHFLQCYFIISSFYTDANNGKYNRYTSVMRNNPVIDNFRDQCYIKYIQTGFFIWRKCKTKMALNHYKNTGMLNYKIDMFYSF